MVCSETSHRIDRRGLAETLWLRQKKTFPANAAYVPCKCAIGIAGFTADFGRFAVSSGSEIISPMNPELARRIIEALRRRDWAALADWHRNQVLARRIDCAHCGHRVRPLSKRFDFDALTVTFECSLCGKSSQVAMKNFRDASPLQPPPAS